ncbi:MULTISPECIES: hypothetical protein [unclassified Mesorhizobium]|uniref:hypothetical protein n=1 Tax=unclassified Mesorhizobium TaxID=325217 RepID=UPI000FE0D971|nr:MULTISPECIES: hypothetical protein [unclassified Mesorhizobium]RWE25129.1 MAG: hypothetical protein EOS41_13070 [Mesorhizobium sp.]TGQ19001.1 hypothetical protein EN860_021150 [Mesorhizobium sp. M00.F.Ca.ET.217.01.1.1]TIU88161.1 MAG: hypothetical protein E5W06_03125 [Mesorhizobium sp.]
MESLRLQFAVNGSLTANFDFSGGRNPVHFMFRRQQHLRRARNDKASRDDASVLLFGVVLTNDDIRRPPNDSSAY